ncbi:MAG: hypothetical protein JO276_14095 [Sphingomonadaceae bacterium]|nr:hypothetical protein [Sphingomonadaceae bacterium]
MAELLYVVWLVPLIIYVTVLLVRSRVSVRQRGLLITAAVWGNILLLIFYAQALAALDRLQRARALAEAERCTREHLSEACPVGYGIWDPPPPPLHWEWVVVAYVFAMAGLYVLLHMSEQRLARRGDDEG